MESRLKQGYKQTEVGFIPEDWKVKKLGNVGEPKMCKRIFNHQTKKRGDIPFFKIGTFGKLPDAFISKELYHRFKRKYSFPKEGTILISAAGTIGRLVIYNGEDAYYQDSNIVWIDNDESLISNEYLKHIFPKIKFRTEGSTINRLYNNILKSGKFPCPTLTEQKAIATSLSDVDELITNLGKLISKKKAIKQGAMQQLLTPPHKGGKRLPGFEGEWVEKLIGKIGNTFGGLSGKSKRDFEDGKHPYITFLNVMNNTVIDTSIFEYVNLKPGEQQNKARKGDLFFNTSSETPEEVGMCAVLNEDFENLYLNSFCFGFRLKEDYEVDALFFSYLINSSIGRDLFLSLAQGATRYNLSKSNFNKLNIEIPETKEEQQAIAQILSDMDAEITQLESKKEKYQAIKQGMMQELLTGKTRLI